MRVRFGSFVFDSATRELLGNGRPVHLSPKSFDLLEILIAQRPAVVPKGLLQDRLWPDSFVDEANIGNAIAEIRRALADDPRSPSYVCTVPRRGYRFCADAQEAGAPAPKAAAERPQWWLSWQDATLPLADGENLVGRHPSCAVWINARSVSREHARIVIAGGQATIEDCGSTNGTLVDGTRITSPHLLVDGAAITFGSETATFRQLTEATTAETEPILKK